MQIQMISAKQVRENILHSFNPEAIVYISKSLRDLCFSKLPYSQDGVVLEDIKVVQAKLKNTRDVVLNFNFNYSEFNYQISLNSVKFDDQKFGIFESTSDDDCGIAFASEGQYFEVKYLLEEIKDAF